MIEIVFAHHHGEHLPGDRVKVDEDTARALVAGGRARYAPKTKAAEPKAAKPPASRRGKAR